MSYFSEIFATPLLSQTLELLLAGITILAISHISWKHEESSFALIGMIAAEAILISAVVSAIFAPVGLLLKLGSIPSLYMIILSIIVCIGILGSIWNGSRIKFLILDGGIDDDF